MTTYNNRIGDRDNKEIQIPLKGLAIHDEYIEYAILACLTKYPDYLPDLMQILSPEMFFRHEHRIIYNALLEMYKNNKPIDINLLVAHLRDIQKLEDAGGIEYVRGLSLSENIPSGYRAYEYAKELKKLYSLRLLNEHAIDIITRTGNGDGYSIEYFLNTYNDVYTKIIQHDHQEVKSIRELTDEFFSGKLQQQGFVITTGFFEFDELVKISQGKFLVVAGRPGMGKTSFALSVISNSIIPNQIPAIFFSLEMTPEQITQILLSHYTNTPIAQVSEISPTAINAPLWIYSGQASIDKIISTTKMLKNEYNIKIIFVDYLQLITNPGSGSKHRTRQEEIAEISRSLKMLALTENICVFALAQLNREPEKRDDKRPLLSDIRESGAVENDADFVGLLFRPAYYELLALEYPRDLAILYIGKNRMSKSGITISFTFQSEYMRFITKQIELDSTIMFADIKDDPTRTHLIKVYDTIKKIATLGTTTLRNLVMRLKGQITKTEATYLLGILQEKGYVKCEKAGPRGGIVIVLTNSGKA